jgi:hypothetical protein
MMATPLGKAPEANAKMVEQVVEEIAFIFVDVPRQASQWQVGQHGGDILHNYKTYKRETLQIFAGQ